MKTLLVSEPIHTCNHKQPGLCLAFSFLLLLSGLFGLSVATAASALPSYDRVRVLEQARPIQDELLTNQDGKPFRLSELRGQVVLVFFGFTNCPDVCPLAMARLRQLDKSGGSDLADVAYVLISVDGERDTPEVLKAYLERFSPRFIGLTGEKASVKAIAKEFSVAFFKGSQLENDGDYTVAHSPQIYAVDTAGRLRAEFYNASVEAMSGVTLALLREAQEASKNAQDSE